MNDYTIILAFIIGYAPLILVSTNYMFDATDRGNFCDSIFPQDTLELYKLNHISNEYCYKNPEQFGYEDRYFDIPPREYKP